MCSLGLIQLAFKLVAEMQPLWLPEERGASPLMVSLCKNLELSKENLTLPPHTSEPDTAVPASTTSRSPDDDGVRLSTEHFTVSSRRSEHTQGFFLPKLGGRERAWKAIL